MEVTAKFDRERIWRHGNSVRYLVVRVADTSRQEAPPSPLNLSLVVDNSGSMEGEPLAFAIDAAQRVVRSLSGSDVLSVVTFESSVQDHVVSVRMTAEGRERALQALARIVPMGSTNLSGGWFRGAEHVALEMAAGGAGQNRVIVLSDGHANQGIVDPEALAEHARQLARRGLFTSSVGVGDHYNAETLEAIAVHGGGSHHRAARPHEIVEVVTAELRDIRATAAEGLALTIRHAPGVRIKCLNEFPMTHEGGVSGCDLGSLAAAASRTAVFSVKFPAGEAGQESRFEVQAQWRQPAETEVFGSGTLRLAAFYAAGKENNAQQPDPALAEEVAQVWQASLVRRVIRLNREGRFADAVRRLDRDIPLFSKYARHAASGPRLVAELERLRKAASREWNEGSRKEVEVAMHKRAYSRMDVRAAPPPDWTSAMPE